MPQNLHYFCRVAFAFLFVAVAPFATLAVAQDGFTNTNPNQRAVVQATHSETLASAEPRADRDQDSFPLLNGSGNSPAGRSLGDPQEASPSGAAESNDSSNSAFGSLKFNGTGPLVTVCTSLGIVLALFGLFAWGVRRWQGKNGGGAVPQDVYECLGSTSLGPRTKLNLIRIGRRIVAVAESPSGWQPIAQFDSPEEVEELLASFQRKSRTAFAKTLNSFEKDSVEGGFAGARSNVSGRARSSSRNPATSSLHFEDTARPIDRSDAYPPEDEYSNSNAMASSNGSHAVDARLVDPRNIDPRNIDPRTIDPKENSRASSENRSKHSLFASM